MVASVALDILCTMDDVVVVDNDDSENSIIEIEPPSKPAPLVIDILEDDEDETQDLLLNVKGTRTFVKSAKSVLTGDKEDRKRKADDINSGQLSKQAKSDIGAKEDKGNDMGTDMGTEMGTEMGTDMGTDMGNDMETDMDNDMGNDMGTSTTTTTTTTTTQTDDDKFRDIDAERKMGKKRVRWFDQECEDSKSPGSSDAAAEDKTKPKQTNEFFCQPGTSKSFDTCFVTSIDMSNPCQMRYLSSRPNIVLDPSSSESSDEESRSLKNIAPLLYKRTNYEPDQKKKRGFVFKGARHPLNIIEYESEEEEYNIQNASSFFVGKNYPKKTSAPIKEVYMKPSHPDHWTPDMIKFYDEDWGNEADFEVEKIQAKMNADPKYWEIAPKDKSYWRRRYKRSNLKCYNCCSYGHESYQCVEPRREPKCHMCGLSGHLAYNCPETVCLNCGRATTAFVNFCNGCKYTLTRNCARCNLTGHIHSECTDHWRLYHSTIGTENVKEPEEDIYKSKRNRWCCNCGRRGHLQIDCEFCVKNAEFCDTLPFVTSYTRSFVRKTKPNADDAGEGPSTFKKAKIEVKDNILTNPKPQDVYLTRTTQLKNHLKSLKRNERMDRGGNRDWDRNRRGLGSFDPINFN